MTKTWAEFYDWVQPHVAGCPEDTITQHLRWAAAEFCERSEVWRWLCETEYTAISLSEYLLPVPSGSVVANVLSVYVNGTPLERWTDLDFDISPDEPDAVPRIYHVYQNSRIKMYPAPDQVYPIRAECVLKPSQVSTTVPDFIHEHYGKDIACGALATLTGTPRKEWTDAALSTYYQLKFARACDQAKGRDTQRANRRVSGPKFA